MNKSYAQPVYRAAGGAICETEEEAREKSRKHYAYEQMRHDWAIEGYDKTGLLWFLDHAEPLIARYKKACEYADARLAEADNTEEN